MKASNGIVLLGPPGSGKSSLAAELERVFDPIVRFAVRAALEKEKSIGSKFGMEYSLLKKEGQWLPDEFVCRFMRNLFESGHFSQRFIIEGFPATKGQVEWFQKFSKEFNLAQPLVVYLKVPEHICFNRVKRRKVCPQCNFGVNTGKCSSKNPDLCYKCGSQLISRPDDEPSFFQARYRLHERLVANVKEAFGGHGLVLDETNTISDNLNEICKMYGGVGG